IGGARPLAALAHKPDQTDLAEGLQFPLHLARRTLRRTRDGGDGRKDARPVIVAGVDQLEQDQLAHACAHVRAEAYAEEKGAHSGTSPTVPLTGGRDSPGPRKMTGAPAASRASSSGVGNHADSMAGVPGPLAASCTVTSRGGRPR